MPLGFTKQYDTSIYEKDAFIEVWPEVAEIGLEIVEGVLEGMDASTVITPGSKNEATAYLKGCMFMLGFSDIDKGTEVELYDQHTSVAVVKTRLVMNDMGIKVQLADVIDLEFVEGLRDLFASTDETYATKLWDVLKDNKAKAQLPIEVGVPRSARGSEQGVAKAKTDPNASARISAPTSSVIRGKQIQPGVNFPEDPAMADKSIQYSLSKDGSKQLSANFKVSDFKCRDGSDVVLVNPSLVDLLEKIRSHFGRPVKVVSAYRTPKYNRMLKGAAKNSQHMYGNAADIKIDGVSPKEVYDWLNTWHKGGLGLYPTFTHIDVRNTVGRDIARWGSGKTTGTA